MGPIIHVSQGSIWCLQASTFLARHQVLHLQPQLLEEAPRHHLAAALHLEEARRLPLVGSSLHLQSKDLL